MRRRQVVLLAVAAVAVLTVLAALIGGFTAGDAEPAARSTRSPEPAATARPTDATSAPRPSADPVATMLPAPDAPDGGPVALPPVGARADYQLGGASPVEPGVRIVARDRTDPAAGEYAICYVNAFQAQPGEESTEPGLLLRDRSGEVVVDEDWNESLFDTRAPTRDALVTTVGSWIDGCAASGFDAVELDNLDSWTRSAGLLTADDNLAVATALIARAHAAGLAVAQKNGAEITQAGRAAGFDFAVVEQCAEYDECDTYTAVYGRNVIEIEYTQTSFAAACAARGDTISVVLRDRDLQPAGTAGHLARWCD